MASFDEDVLAAELVQSFCSLARFCQGSNGDSSQPFSLVDIRREEIRQGNEVLF